MTKKPSSARSNALSVYDLEAFVRICEEYAKDEVTFRSAYRRAYTYAKSMGALRDATADASNPDDKPAQPVKDCIERIANWNGHARVDLVAEIKERGATKYKETNSDRDGTELTELGRHIYFNWAIPTWIALGNKHEPPPPNPQLQTIRIATHPMFDSGLLPFVIPSFVEEQKMKGRRVDVVVQQISSIYEGVQALREGRADFVLDGLPPRWKDESFKRIELGLSIQQIVLIPKSLQRQFREKATLKPEDIASFNIAALNVYDPIWKLFGDWLWKGQYPDARRIVVATASAMREYVSQPKSTWLGVTGNWLPAFGPKWTSVFEAKLLTMAKPKQWQLYLIAASDPRKGTKDTPEHDLLLRLQTWCFEARKSRAQGHPEIVSDADRAWCDNGCVDSPVMNRRKNGGTGGEGE